MSTSWYVLSIKAHKEQPVHRYLQNHQIETYFPTMRMKSANPRSRSTRSFFPGYMFVNIDLDQHGENRLRWIPGTRGLVRFGDQPAMVPEHVFRELRKQVRMINSDASKPRRLQRGDRIRVINGPFKGYEAIFDAHLSGKDRVQVLLAFLNQHPRRLRMSVHDVEKVA